MNKVISFLIKTPIDDKWLADKVLQISLSNMTSFIENRYPIEIIDDYDQLNSYINQAEFLFISAIGAVIIDYDVIWNQLHSIPDDVGLIGHIIWYPYETTPHLADHMFIIRTAALKEKQINFKETSTQEKKFIRSVKDMHDDHAPLWVELTDEIVQRDSKFGTSLLSLILENGYKVRNFDKDWRTAKRKNLILPNESCPGLEKIPTKGYLYPKINSKLFSYCLKNLVIHEELYDAQKECILIFKECLKFNVLNAYHYDNTMTNFRDYCNGENANLIISTANGFQGEAMALFNGAKKIIFYDKNPNNIKFKKHLYENFDGNNYESFYQKYAQENNLRIEPETDKEILDVEDQMLFTNEVLEKWDIVKTFEKEFITGDLFDIIDQLLYKIEEKTLFYTSTIISQYLLTRILRSDEDILLLTEKIEHRISATNSFWYKV